MLSVVIIARDAEKTIGSTIKSVVRIADEIVVVVDDRSVDTTAEIAKHHGARVVSHKFVNYADQKNFGLTKARQEWVLALDADEQVSSDLAAEITRVLPATDLTAFKIRRLNYIFGKAMRHTNWEPSADNHVWLWKRQSGKWVGDVHEEVMVAGKVGQLKGYKLHANYSTVEEYLVKMNDYTSRESHARSPIGDFVRRYLWHAGWLDGWHGLFLSYLQMISHIAVWVKLWEKKRSP